MSSEAWINDLRDQMPESGETTIIVSRSSGVSYLKLSRQSIEAFNQKRQRLRKIAVLSASAFVVLSATVSMYFVERVGSLEAKVLQRDLLIANIAAPLENFITPFAADNSTVDWVANNDQLPAQVSALTSLVQLQDESFRFYVEATRELITKEQETLRNAVNELGLQYQPLIADNNPVAVGGISIRDEILALVNSYIDDPLYELLNEQAQVREAVDALPLSAPLKEARVTSRFGYRRHPITGSRELHNGVDFVSYTHPEVIATADGVVSFADRDGSYGKKVVLEHANQVSTLYAHLDSISVEAGQHIEKGTVIGVMGNTGRSTATHLHYEILLNGRRIDPRRLEGVREYVR